MAKESIAAKLRNEVAQARGPEDGTVVRFDSVIPTHHGHSYGDEQKERRYTYAAVYVKGHWYLTGESGFFGASSFTHGQFVIDVLAREGVENIAVATEFEKL